MKRTSILTILTITWLGGWSAITEFAALCALANDDYGWFAYYQTGAIVLAYLFAHLLRHTFFRKRGNEQRS